MDANRETFNSQHILRHISDILRILTLWKYSGTYFDLDVIVKKPISQRGKNFACIQEDGLINSAIVNLDSKLGKSIAEKNFKQVSEHFDGNVWSGNGPEVLSGTKKKKKKKQKKTKRLIQQQMEPCKSSLNMKSFPFPANLCTNFRHEKRGSVKRFP